jgi:hypothetical protein
MSTPIAPPPATLVAGLIYGNGTQAGLALGRLEERFGRMDYQGEEMDFTFTRYYVAEMGENLKRKFVSFERMVKREEIVDAKLFTNGVEDSLRSGSGGRSVNIDPGLLSLENLVLATCKGFSHRVYHSRGIFLDVTLLFRDNSFRTLPWTYPDYATAPVIDAMNRLREIHWNKMKSPMAVEVQ